MSDSEEEVNVVHEKQLKIVFLGESNVGKTSIIRRFCYDEFTRQYLPTIGADFYMKRVVLPGKREITVRITDVSGEELEGHMLQNYLFNTNMIILVYDITNCVSFDSLTVWLKKINDLFQVAPIVTIFGNKCDMEHKRAVRLDKTKHFLAEYKLMNVFVSAKTGETINSCLMELVARYFGVPLTRFEREKQANVVRAELIKSAENLRQLPTTNTRIHHSNTTVCNLQ